MAQCAPPLASPTYAAARACPGDRPGVAKREPGRVAMDGTRAACGTRVASGGAP
ncbi:hypothetical protein [Kibdelosporangium philippinense]|uniref:hypothetical protein n=1 Tax=Kibdelosporangium philippinense TaxID=211113 RepID=UPI00360A62A4